MNKFFNWLEKYLLPPMTKLSEQRHLKAIRDGIVSTIPLIIIGSFFLVIAVPPNDWLKQLVAPYVNQIMFPYRLSMGIMALYAAFGIAYNLAKSYKLDPLSGGSLGLAAFLLTNVPLNIDPNGWMLSLSSLGGSGMFTAIIMSIFAVEIFRVCKEKNLTIKMPKEVPTSVANSFAALIPAAFIIVPIWIIRDLLNFDIQKFVLSIFTPLVTAGNSLPGILVPILLITLLWGCGIHGDSVVGTVARPIWLAMLDANVAAQAAGQPIPNIAPEPFFQWFVWIGGSGATIGLVILMLGSKSRYLKDIARASLIPGICNINEPVIFGAPIMLNPLLIIPFILGPLICGCVSYFAMTLNLVSKPVILAPWTLPAPIGAYLATGGDWRAIILVLINIAIVTALYFPFLKAYEKKLIKEGMENN
ncbi:PTS sugar transporter subunit IIC [Clostridium beijerinckii]|jgi:PTS system cellobiose-specific IIC component|uniref:Permease IIC component n=2 Tax=Clostridium beijerinckii TaxID=1520 RepID=A0AAE2RS38_CLOBE|nr:PTS sugar transporter subunit IIC [Clostridium beijerinckii]ABR34818.1 PTS system, lactose/cellobiose family IIC subunit [Clostridium beijerinckii NCIMB 8052]AIU04567.1 PTS system lactose/cellobiose family IIC subunit [Clostridium beijerinckii ATCC 35702]MBF7810553.1 PTS sugar transporter subunit IIC [Clostridium beijerinckii]NOW91262.1 PTS system cellobiose-specific IIC component [Clostridium beijerinckii]NRT23825.1 PTS system cellobiose-specific IIC component [Clostridium beijerinckii]